MLNNEATRRISSAALAASTNELPYRRKERNEDTDESEARSRQLISPLERRFDAIERTASLSGDEQITVRIDCDAVEDVRRWEDR